MSEGFVYRWKDASEEALRQFLNESQAQRGWSWSATDMHLWRSTGEPVLADEGRASSATVEVRWRRRGTTYTVLLLALAAQSDARFEPLSPREGAWQTQPQQYRLQRPSEANDEVVPAMAFLSPDGSTHFVALIGKS